MTPEEIMRDALRRIRDAKAPEGFSNPDAWFEGYARSRAALALIQCGQLYIYGRRNVKLTICG